MAAHIKDGIVYEGGSPVIKITKAELDVLIAEGTYDKAALYKIIDEDYPTVDNLINDQIITPKTTWSSELMDNYYAQKVNENGGNVENTTLTLGTGNPVTVTCDANTQITVFLNKSGTVEMVVPDGSRESRKIMSNVGNISPIPKVLSVTFNTTVAGEYTFTFLDLFGETDPSGNLTVAKKLGNTIVGIENNVSTINNTLTPKKIDVTPKNIGISSFVVYIENNTVHIKGYVRISVAISAGNTSQTPLFSIPTQYKPLHTDYSYSIGYIYDKYCTMLCSLNPNNEFCVYRPSQNIAINDVLVVDTSYPLTL